MEVLPLESCKTLLAFLGMCSALTGASTSLLFLLRVRAVYLKSTCVTVVFGAIWLIVLALNVAASSTIRPGEPHYKSSPYISKIAQTSSPSEHLLLHRHKYNELSFFHAKLCKLCQRYFDFLCHLVSFDNRCCHWEELALSLEVDCVWKRPLPRVKSTYEDGAALLSVSLSYRAEIPSTPDVSLIIVP